MTRPLFALVLAACGRQPVDQAPPADATPTTSNPIDDPATTTPTPTPTTDPTTEDPATTIPCTPPTLLLLSDIPDSPLLAAAPDVALATFEVDGDQLVGKAVRNAAVAEDALVAWQELVMRVPLNQRTQLVQFTIEDNEEERPLSAVDIGGTDNQTGRYGQHLKILQVALQPNADVCAPLTGQYGTFDWTLVHAIGLLRGHADGSRESFARRFSSDGGPGGMGYPADGTPSLTGDFVTSFAEQYGGYEDAAESFTAYVMLDPLPNDNSVAGDKVRSFAEVPDYEDLRLALRVTEPGGGASVPDAPLVEYVLDIHNPSWMWGTWEGDGPNGPVQYVIDEFGMVFRETVADGTEELDWAQMRDDGSLATVRVLGTSLYDHTYQVAVGSTLWLEIFIQQTDGISVERSDWGSVELTRVPN